MKKRIILYSILLGILTVTFGLGIYGLISATRYKNNNVSFVVNNNQAYFSSIGQYYCGENAILSGVPNSSYEARYTQADYYNGANGTVDAWQIGASEFIYSDIEPETNVSTLKYVIKIKNENSERNLSVKLNGVAVNQYNYFITNIKYQNGDNSETTVFSNDPENLVNYNLYFNPTISPNKVDIPTEEVVQRGDTLTVTITLTLNTKTKAFNLENNFGFVLDSVAI